MDENKAQIIARAKKQKLLKRDASDWRKYKLETSKILNDLLNQMPDDNKKYTVIKRMIKVFWANKWKVPNYLLARCIYPTISNRNNERVKFTKDEYAQGKAKFDIQIQNRFRTLRELIKPLGYNVSFDTQKSGIIPPTKQF